MQKVDESFNALKNIKLTVEYDGTNYHGWQRQENAVSVQGTLEKAISALTGETCTLTGCSRTDVGVHALSHISNFKTLSRIPPDRFSYALNRILPTDIVVKKSEEATPDFHARFQAKGKKYRYLIYNAMFPSAILRTRSCHVSHVLDIESMRKAAECFLGTHDFAAFMATGSDVKTTVRTIMEVSLRKEEDVITFEIKGDGFLYNMVRIIVGTLIEVGCGRISQSEIPGIIAKGNRNNAGRTAPSQGLYLVDVEYQ